MPWANIFFKLAFIRSTKELPSGCKTVENLGLQPNNSMNLSFSWEVKYVALSEVMTLGMPTKEKTCNKHSHTAFALTDLSGKANGKSCVWVNQAQTKVILNFIQQGSYYIHVQMWKWYLITWYNTNRYPVFDHSSCFFWQAKHVSTYSRIVLDIPGQKKFKNATFL